MKVGVTGSSGQLGSELQELAKNSSHEFHFFDETDLDITNQDQMQKAFGSQGFNLIVNAAAYTQVDAAESNEELAYRVNADGPRLLCEWAKTNSARVLHISTDFIFDGKSSTPYSIRSEPGPLSAYGRTKLAGEKFCRDSQVATVIRTSWVYSTYGKNFVKSILRKLEAGEDLKVVNDQVGRPTYAQNLAKFIVEHLEKWVRGSGSEVWHFSDGGQCSWYEFACKIRDLSGFKNSIEPIRSEVLNLPARRPAYSCLDLSETKNRFSWAPEAWDHALSRMLKAL